MNQDVSLTSLTTLKTGGVAKYFCRAVSDKKIKDAVAFAIAKKLPIFVLGGGSNVLVADDGFPGLVIKIETRGILYEEKGGACLARAAAGESWDTFVADTVSRGLWGLENLSGIPGTVGAAPVQNIGAYGTEVKDSIESVRAFDVKTGEEKVFSNVECQFEYRDSFFKKPEGKKYIILEVVFKLSKEPRPNISYKDLQVYFAQKSPEADVSSLRNASRPHAPVGAAGSVLALKHPLPTIFQIRSAVLQIRSKKFPDLSKVGTAGSFFKNPIISQEHFEKLKAKFPDLPSFPAKNGVKIPLAFVLDKICGLKGFKKGSVELFQNQPLVLINIGGASAGEIKSFSAEIKKIVFDKTGIEVEEEVVCI